MRLIDADALTELFREVIGHIAKEPTITKDMEHMVRASAMTIEMIADAPTVDAVEVVRCRECECACLIDSINMSYHCTHPQWCTSSYGVSGDDFCSYGERRNDV